MFNLVPMAFSSTIFKMADRRGEGPGDEVGLAHCRNVRALGRVSYIDWIKNLNISAELSRNEKLPTQVQEFSAKNCPNGSLAKVAKFHTNPCNFLACLPNPYKLSILGDI